jgi:hypothetical protein
VVIRVISLHSFTVFNWGISSPKYKFGTTCVTSFENFPQLGSIVYWHTFFSWEISSHEFTYTTNLSSPKHFLWKYLIYSFEVPFILVTMQSPNLHSAETNFFLQCVCIIVVFCAIKYLQLWRSWVRFPCDFRQFCHSVGPSSKSKY